VLKIFSDTKVNKLPINSSCTGTYQCNNQIGLICSAGSCVCNTTQYYDYSTLFQCGKKKKIINHQLSIINFAFLLFKVNKLPSGAACNDSFQCFDKQAYLCISGVCTLSCYYSTLTCYYVSPYSTSYLLSTSSVTTSGICQSLCDSNAACGLAYYESTTATCKLYQYVANGQILIPSSPCIGNVDRKCISG
jgi:hypothetical protein